MRSRKQLKQQSERLMFYLMLDELSRKFEVEMVNSVFENNLWDQSRTRNVIAIQKDLLSDAFDCNGDQVSRIILFINNDSSNVKHIVNLYNFDLLQLGDATALFYLVIRPFAHCIVPSMQIRFSGSPIHTGSSHVSCM